MKISFGWIFSFNVLASTDMTRFSTVLDYAWIRALFSFGSMHIVSLLIPLLAFPWLGRVLEPAHFGLLMYMCLFPPFLTLLVEWGFPLGGARLAARCRGDNQALCKLLGEVVTAKLILSIVAFNLSIALIPFFPYAREWPQAFLMAVIAGIAKAMSPLWFYQGTGQKLPILACWDMGFSFLALAMVFIFIHEPEQWMLYLLFTGLCRLASNAGLTCLLWRKYPFKIKLEGSLRIIRETTALFGALFFSNVYHYCFQLVLGYFLLASEMGIIVALDKMLRALIGLLNPFTQALFPEVCILHDKDPRSAWRILRLALLATFLASSLAAFMVWLLAPWLTRLALGSAYQAAPEILRIMLFSVPPAACSKILGSQAMVPFGHDKIQALICAWVSLLSIPLSAALACWKGMAGGAFVPLCVESALCIAFLYFILKKEKISFG